MESSYFAGPEGGYIDGSLALSLYVLIPKCDPRLKQSCRPKSLYSLCALLSTYDCSYPYMAFLMMRAALFTITYLGR